MNHTNASVTSHAFSLMELVLSGTWSCPGIINERSPPALHSLFHLVALRKTYVLLSIPNHVRHCAATATATLSIPQQQCQPALATRLCCSFLYVNSEMSRMAMTPTMQKTSTTPGSRAAQFLRLTRRCAWACISCADDGLEERRSFAKLRAGMVGCLVGRKAFFFLFPPLLFLDGAHSVV